MKIHKVKTHPGYFGYGQSGEKPFEVRLDDRGYQVGDVLRQREWSPRGGYTGKKFDRLISYTMRDKDYVKEGFVVLGLVKVPLRIRARILWKALWKKLTADKATIMHGEWEKRTGRGDGVYCSVCNDYNFTRSKYCPGCGAKMDGEQGKEESL